MRRVPDAAEFAAQRERMVEWQLRQRGIADERVLEAMAAVPRERFVPEGYRRRAYADSALPIGYGQTISQPWIVAAICEALALEGRERVLEVGTGSGYSAAVLAMLAGEAITIERVGELAAAAREALEELGVTNVEVVVGDGSRGQPERAPFEGIAVHATAPAPPPTLIEQLSVGGRLVVPIATEAADMLTVFQRVAGELGPEGEGLERTVIGPCRFVPLIGSEGFPE
ncbi:MAG TPA: protein-L-isoaspartate(D-aspartate) O-methyltransferase [Solirubrobacterales bacterium]|nr:protein-L-isoaspartate(D-aspartate) O-methyltransferase [Solirubrobacterales bacterium]